MDIIDERRREGGENERAEQTGSSGLPAQQGDTGFLRVCVISSARRVSYRDGRFVGREKPLLD